MHEITPATSTEINRLHQLATRTANEALEHAKLAGELLLQVKGQLQYGEFIPWIEVNLAVSVRQAQRYMAAAQGKQVSALELASTFETAPELLRNDTVSYLSNAFSEEEADSLLDCTWEPKWKPEAGHWYTTATKNGAYWVVPDKEKPDLFHVSRLYSGQAEDDGGFFDGTRWAESADLVEITLKSFQLSTPEKAIWKTSKRAGLSKPFGAPEGYGKIRVVRKDGQAQSIREAS